MELWMAAGILLALSVLLFIYSFTQKQEKEQAYKELEEFSLTVTRSMYDLNKRVKALESELGIESLEHMLPQRVTQLNKDNIITMFTKGYPTEAISQQLNIASTSVQEIIDAYVEEGIRA
ncbi:helix-turn-helix domain-containing protein [Alkalibacterium putridalgicola]|jgi:citrate lyase beta subunit|uniref:helix-turn-helix domain-containing protein n=1 Tax=Alkalibacterium putridalgicola TaxID=426703 RepID=UPI0034CF5C69